MATRGQQRLWLTPPWEPLNFPDSGPPPTVGGLEVKGPRPSPPGSHRPIIQTSPRHGPSSSSPTPDARSAAGVTCGGPGRGAEAGRAKGRPRRPPPPTGPPRSGVGEWGGVRVSLSLRHRPRSWRRRSGRYPGPSWGVAKRRGNSAPRKALSRFSDHSGNGPGGGSGLAMEQGRRSSLLGRAFSNQSLFPF